MSAFKGKSAWSGWLLLLLLIVGISQYRESLSNPAPDDDVSALAEAFSQGRSDVWLNGVGEVSKLLPDDNNGSRHQRFVLTLAHGQTVLVAHNIDLAPRIDGLVVGDRIRFRGEYEWTAQGGVVHWTHHDPRGRHDGGWLEKDGKRYR